MSGFVVAAPSSNQGKTLVTLALLRLLKRRGLSPRPFKVGPDYIDPAFHAFAANATCSNLDSFAMSPEQIRCLAYGSGEEGPVIVEGVMGLFDGGANGLGSTASVARILGCPVVLVVDASSQGQSLAALVKGFAEFDPGLNIAAVVLNRVASQRHLARLTEHLTVPILAALPKAAELTLPSRHLGLVQAQETSDLDSFCEAAADWLETKVDEGVLAKLLKSNQPSPSSADTPVGLVPLGQHIAIAKDDAFAFAYSHVLQHWRDSGCTLSFFSPLANEGPHPACDAVYLPGGYPELHAEKLASATKFKQAMLSARDAGAWIYGECGGYMVLGEHLIDKASQRHQMLGLLPVSFSFQTPKRNLGYRRVEALTSQPFSSKSPQLQGHEYHYCQETQRDKAAQAAFRASDSDGCDLGAFGLHQERVFGSFLHLINQRPS